MSHPVVFQFHYPATIKVFYILNIKRNHASILMGNLDRCIYCMSLYRPPDVHSRQIYTKIALESNVLKYTIELSKHRKGRSGPYICPSSLFNQGEDDLLRAASPDCTREDAAIGRGFPSFWKFQDERSVEGQGSLFWKTTSFQGMRWIISIGCSKFWAGD